MSSVYQEYKDLHIVSWNVASWLTTLAKIKRRHGSLDTWLEKHKIDILCIQEVKISSSEICYRAKDIGAVNLTGFESFWACPIVSTSGNTSKLPKSSTPQGGGLNGVATFAKLGFTCRATSKSLGNSAFDNEGRCLLTDHGTFVIFNIYVPNSGQQCKRYPFKIQFLKALENAVEAEKQKGKRVIIVGDFNIAPRANDVARDFRYIDMSALMHLELNQRASDTDLEMSRLRNGYENVFTNDSYCESLGRCLSGDETVLIREAVGHLQAVWPAIEASLRSSVQVIKEGDKYRLVSTRLSDGKQVWLPI